MPEQGRKKQWTSLVGLILFKNKHIFFKKKNLIFNAPLFSLKSFKQSYLKYLTNKSKRERKRLLFYTYHVSLLWFLLTYMEIWRF